MTMRILTKSSHAIHHTSLYATYLSPSFYSAELLNVFLSWEKATNIRFIYYQSSLQNMHEHKYTYTQKLISSKNLYK